MQWYVTVDTCRVFDTCFRTICLEVELETGSNIGEPEKMGRKPEG